MVITLHALLPSRLDKPCLHTSRLLAWRHHVDSEGVCAQWPGGVQRATHWQRADGKTACPK